MDKINSNVIDFSPAESPAGPSVGQVYIDLDGTLKRGIFAGQSAASFEAVRQANNERYAASGFVHMGKHAVQLPNIVNINEGLWSLASEGFQDRLTIGRKEQYAKSGTSKTDHGVLNMTGVLFSFDRLPSSEFSIKFPQAPDGKTTYHKTKGEVKVHVDTAAAFIYANQSDNIEVVTDRVDMWGFEAYLEEVTTTNPFVYPNGLIQSQATTMNGIATSASNRPVSYYAVFEGDTGSKGKGLDVTKLSYVQLATILGDHKHNLYYLADGRLVQWRLRQRTIAGAGNGDWVNIESAKLSASPSNYLQYSTGKDTVKPQGMRNAGLGNTFNYPLYGGVAGEDVVPKAELSLYAAHGAGKTPDPSAGINGECYFLVCGTVNRLNQGAYHPSFNPNGAANFFYNTGEQAAEQPWYDSSSKKPSSTANCFDFATSGNTLGNVSPFVYSGYGSINGIKSGRPDGRHYDAIYAEGQGGVCRDMRYSANGVDTVDFAEADHRVKSGTYRGFERPKFSKVFQTQTVEANNGTVNFINGTPSEIKEGGILISVSGVRSKIATVTPNAIYTVNNNGVGVNEPIIVESQLSSSVGGLFLQTDVIGNPENILATPALANGWQGSWGQGDVTVYSGKALCREAVSTTSSYLETEDNTSWKSYPNTEILSALNAVKYGQVAARVSIIQYQAFASQTEPAANAVIYGKQSGVGKVFFNFHHSANTGCLLTESMLGKVIVGTLEGRAQDSVIMYNPFLYLDGTNAGKLVKAGSGYEHSHYPTSITRSNGSLGSKALNYNVNLNQQAFVQYAYTELKHNGTNWGDDGKVTIVDNQATKTDLNGDTVLVGTARLREPLGWLTQSSQPRNASRAELRISFNQWTKAVKPLEERGGIYGK